MGIMMDDHDWLERMARFGKCLEAQRRQAELEASDRWCKVHKVVKQHDGCIYCKHDREAIEFIEKEDFRI
jgi:hypothetical protein